MSEGSQEPDGTGRRALAVWKEKLDFLLVEEAQAGSTEKFSFKKLIEEARERIAELEMEVGSNSASAPRPALGPVAGDPLETPAIRSTGSPPQLRGCWIGVVVVLAVAVASWMASFIGGREFHSIATASPQPSASPTLPPLATPTATGPPFEPPPAPSVKPVPSASEKVPPQGTEPPAPVVIEKLLVRVESQGRHVSGLEVWACPPECANHALVGCCTEKAEEDEGIASYAFRLLPAGQRLKICILDTKKCSEPVEIHQDTQLPPLHP